MAGQGGKKKILVALKCFANENNVIMAFHYPSSSTHSHTSVHARVQTHPRNELKAWGGINVLL